MPAIPMPDQGTQQLLDQAYANARSQLKGQAPDSLLHPFAGPAPVRGSVTLGTDPYAAPAAPPTDPTPNAQPVSIDGPPETAEPVTPAKQPSTFEGFWPTLGNRIASGAVKGAEGLARFFTGVAAAAAPYVPDETGTLPQPTREQTDQGADQVFKAIDSTFDPAIQKLQQTQNAREQAGDVGTGSKLVGGIAEGAAPLAFGPSGFLAASTMNAGTDVVNEGGDLRAAYTVAGVSLLANAAGMKVPIKSPSLIKRVLLNGAYGAEVSAASQYLAKETLSLLHEQGMADQINPLDPTDLGSSALVSAIFGALEKPKVAAKFKDLGGTVPGAEPPPPTAQPVAPVKSEAPTTATPAPTEAGPQPAVAVPDRPSAEPMLDLQAQIADMKNPQTARKAVYLSPGNVKELGPQGVAKLADGAKQIRNFDKKGGVLVVPDVDTARAARDLRNSEPDMQKVLGALTGAGDGKSPLDTAVVQGHTPEGAVATEASVRPEEVPAKVAEVQADGKTPVVTTPAEAVARREEVRAAEPAATAEPAAEEAPPVQLAVAKFPSGEKAVQILGDAGEGKTRVRLLNEEGEPGEEATIPSESIGETKAETISAGSTEPEADKTAESDQPKKSQLEQAMDLFQKQETSAPGKKFPAKLSERQDNASSFAAVLKSAADEAYTRKSASDETISRAHTAAGDAIGLTNKTPEATAKGQGTGHERVSAINAEMMKAARGLLGKAEPGDEVRVKPREAVIKARVARKASEVARKVPEPDANAPKKTSSVEGNTITVKPHVIRGREMQALAHELGVDPADIAKEAEAATGKKRGALSAFMQEMAGGLDPNKGWLAHMSALNPARSKESPLNRSQHLQLGNLIKRVAMADAKDVPHARDALDNFMHDVNGKKLDDRTQAAVHEYAQARRRMELIKEQIHEETDEGPGESVYDEHEESAAHEGYTDSELETREIPINYGDRLWGSVTSKLDRAGFLDHLAGIRDRGALTSLHELLDFASSAADAGPARSIINSIRKTVQDIPVQFVNDVVSRKTGEAYNDNTRGLYSFSPGRGINDIQVSLKAAQHPLKILLHEAAHAATHQFMLANPSHELTLRMEDLRRVALARVERMLGRKFEQSEMKGRFYGLSNKDEFVAEALSNADFQELLARSEKFATPLDRVRDILHKLADTIREMLGINDGPAAKLFNNVLDTAGRIMTAQHESLRARADYMGGLDDFLSQHPLRDDHELSELRAIDEEPPRLRNEEKIMRDVPEVLRGTLRSFKHVTKSGAWDAVRKNVAGFASFDQLVRRGMRHFGSSEDPKNPVRAYAETRADRLGVQNKAIENSAKVAEDWLRLNPEQSRRVGQFMIDSTIWGIDPTVAKADHNAKTQAMRGFDARYQEFADRWKNLSPAERSVYERARDDNKRLVKLARKTAVDVVLKSVESQLTPVQRTLLYAVRDPRQFDQLIGDKKAIDLQDQNEMVRESLKDLASITEMEGPYFHLGREGSKVVQVTPEGNKEFTDKASADKFASLVRELGPASKAKVTEQNGKYVVDYDAQYVSMHNSAHEAEADAARLRSLGFEVKGVTEKAFSKENAPLTHGMTDLVAEAQRKIEAHGTDEATEAMTQALRNAFVQLVAARSAYAGSKLARKGVAGVKAGEMRMNYARHAQSMAWHIANMSTIFEQADALSKMREAARNPDVGNADQDTMYARGRMVHELGRRVQQEVSDYGTKQPMNSWLAKLGFLNFLASPAHALIWTTQNITTGIPVAGARYGYGRTMRAFAKGMASPAIPALRQTMKGVFSKPGEVTGNDVTSAILAAIEKDPSLSKWKPHFQQLIDRGAINSSLSNELASIAKGENSTIAKTFEWARLLPHMADAYNRISTAIAGLELTNGDVQKTADLVREVHVDYSYENKPRAFKSVSRLPMGNSITMMKSYVQGMAHLLYSNVYDAITGEGKSRAEAAKTVAGMIIGTALFTGMTGATPEPLRFALYAYNKLFGDDNQYSDVNNQMRHWMTDALGERAGEIAASGLPRAAGFDVSSRMGLSDLFFHNPPDMLGPGKITDKLKDMVFALAGPVPEWIGQTADDYRQHMARGEPGQAMLSLVPVKALHDAQKAYTLVTRGRQTGAGQTVMGPEKFSGYDAALQAFGLKPEKVANVQERQSTAYDYRQWAEGRKLQIIAQWTSAPPAERQDVQEQIAAWNKANPGMRITRSDLIRQMRSGQRAQQIGEGKPGRDPTVNRLLSY